MPVFHFFAWFRPVQDDNVDCPPPSPPPSNPYPQHTRECRGLLAWCVSTAYFATVLYCCHTCAVPLPHTAAVYCRPVQDSECGQLQPGTRMVVLAKWPDRDEQKYYDAEVLSADRKEHGAGEGPTHPRGAST